MKHKRIRPVCLLLTLALMLGMTACNKPTTEENEPIVLKNGNVITLPAETGTEEELTAVRESLVKYAELDGFEAVEKLELYENGVRTASDEYVQVKDNKKFYYAGDKKRLVHYPDGYILDMPADWQPDFTLSSAVSVFTADGLVFTASNETEYLKYLSRPEEDTGVFWRGEAYIASIFRFITTDEYLQKNQVDKLSEETKELSDTLRAYVLRMRLNGCKEDVPSYYTYVVMYTELTVHHLMFKCVDDRDLSEIYTTFRPIYEKGAAVDAVEYPCEDNPSWSEETKAYYDSLMNTDVVQWGLFNGNIPEEPLTRRYPRMEQTLAYEFPIVSSYTDQMQAGFPVNAARKITDAGRHIQYTIHFDYHWGNTMGADAPILDVYRGQLDDEFRRLALDIVKYGEPMLLRINNEMNSDWTSWAAINAMLDPTIFTETWIRMYNIFEEMGANAYCIWIWNPQSERSFPDTRWNDLRLYMPGAKYVDMLGLTSYNFGDEDEWASFEELYTALETYYGRYFGDWGWIISEFGCSDTDEDKTRKAEWITDMFTCFEIGKYPNIKAAVWFNANDYEGGELVHEIVLTDDPKTMEAFRDGLERTQ